MKNDLSNLLCWDPNSRPLDNQSSPTTTRPGLPPTKSIFLDVNCFQDKTVCFVSERLALPSPDKLDANGQLPPGLAVERFTVEYRDIALLVSLRLRGDDPQPYFPYLRLHALRGFFPETIALPEGLDKPREERIQAWQNQKLKSE